MEPFSRWRRTVYASGNLGFSLVDNIFGVYLLFFLIPPKELGMPELINNRPLFLGLTVGGMIVIFGRIIDSLADPLIAHWSDNSRARLGRRKFFMLTGALPLALSTALLFFPPTRTASALNAWYVAIVLGIFFFFYTYYMSPALALIPELSRSHQDRIGITVLQAVFSIVGAAVVMIGAPILWDLLQGAGMERSIAFRLAIALICLVGFLSMFAAPLAVDEKRFCTGEPPGVGLFESIRMTITNRTFIIYMVGVILFWFSFNIIRSMIAYYPVVLLHKEPAFQTVMMAVLFGSAFVTFGLISVAARRITSKALMSAGLLIFAVLMSFTYFVDMLGSFKVTAALIHMALLGIPVAILLVVPNAIVADISEVDGYETGKKREAMFFGTQGLFMKVNYGIATAIAAYLFAAFGKDVAQPLGVKLAGPVGALFSLAGFVVFLSYPQKKVNQKLQEIRSKAE